MSRPKNPPSAGARELVAMPLSEMRAAKRNPKKHSRAIQPSLGRFGYVETIVVDDRTGRIVAGHGRREALMALKASGAEAPEGVHVATDGEWLVPVLRGWRSKTDAEAEAYLLASNHLGPDGGDDEELLAEMMAELDLAGTGLEEIDSDALLAEATEPDVAPKLGDLEFCIMINCSGEHHQAELLKRFESEGLSCRALIS